MIYSKALLDVKCGKKYYIDDGYILLYIHKNPNGITHIKIPFRARKILEISLFFGDASYILSCERTLTVCSPHNLEISRKILGIDRKTGLRWIEKIEFIHYIRRVIKRIPYSWLASSDIATIVNKCGFKILRYIPEDLITQDVINSFQLRHDWEVSKHVYIHPNSPYNIPRHLRTGELAMRIVSFYGGFITLIPRKERTHELIMIAVNSNGRAIKYIANYMKTPEIIEEALISGGEDVLQYISWHLQTDEVKKRALEIAQW